MSPARDGSGEKEESSMAVERGDKQAKKPLLASGWENGHGPVCVGWRCGFQRLLPVGVRSRFGYINAPAQAADLIPGSKPPLIR